MFELFGDLEARKAINEQRMHFAAHVTALATLLIKKGLITESEFLIEFERQKAAIDQIAAAQRDGRMEG